MTAPYKAGLAFNLALGCCVWTQKYKVATSDAEKLVIDPAGHLKHGKVMSRYLGTLGMLVHEYK